MSPIDKDIVRRKLSIMIEDIEALESMKDITVEEYISDVYKRKAAERLLQELIEAAIDVNTHMIVQSCNKVLEDYYESFIMAGLHGIIDAKLSEDLAPSSGLRNRLVHDYDAIDNAVILSSIRFACRLFPVYVREIERYLSSH